MTPLLIRRFLPLLFVLLPVAAGALVIAAVPPKALQFYLHSIRDSYLDWIILGLGLIFFIVQIILAWQAMCWREQGFDERPDRWLQRLHQTSDWFPLLGLFGTLAGILQTFARISAQADTPQQEIIQLYAPSLTTAASGLLMAFLNLLPLWLAAVGRGLILSLTMSPSKPAKGA